MAYCIALDKKLLTAGLGKLVSISLIMEIISSRIRRLGLFMGSAFLFGGLLSFVPGVPETLFAACDRSMPHGPRRLNGKL